MADAMKLVPVEPTEAMLIAMDTNNAGYRMSQGFDFLRDVWANALAASPPAPAREGVVKALQRLEVLRDQARNGTPVTDPNEWEADELDAILATLTAREEAPAEGAEEIAYWLNDLLGDDQNGGFIRNLCYTVWQAGRYGYNGGPGDWGTDTLPTVQEGVQMVRAKVDALLALRARTSEPAREAVAWRAEKEKQTYLYDTDEEYRMHSARSLGFRITPLYTHPAPATADKLRVAKEAFDPRDMKIVGDWIEAGEPAHSVPSGRIKGLWQSARQALATLNDEGNA